MGSDTITLIIIIVCIISKAFRRGYGSKYIYYCHDCCCTYIWRGVPKKFALFSAPILNVFVIILTPFNLLFGKWKKILSLIFKSEENNGITEEESL